MELLSQCIIDSFIDVFGYKLSVKISGYGILIILSSILVYWLYIKRILIREFPPSITTWLLWFLLDVIATIASIKQGYFNLQLIAYTIGTSFICFVLLKRKNICWDKLWDSLTTVVVFLAGIVFIFAENKFWALICSLVGMTIAALPLIRDLMREEKQPWMEPWDSWFIIMVGSIFSYLDGNIISGIWLGFLQLLILIIIIYWNVRKFVSQETV